jgi:hypothetical protein
MSFWLLIMEYSQDSTDNFFKIIEDWSNTTILVNLGSEET